MTKTIILESDFDFESPLEKVIEEITELKAKYSNFSNLRFNKDYARDYSYYELLGDREETKEEVLVRERVVEQNLARRKEQIRKEAEKLGLL